MYKHILFATDFSNQAGSIESRVAEQVKQNGAQLSVVHTVEYYPSVQFPTGYTYSIDLESKLQENAQKEMQACAERLSVKDQNTHIALGAAKRAIIDYANEIEADLIIMGSHGRHGLGLLLGSTANGVLHAAKCDVLAVRIQE